MAWKEALVMEERIGFVLLAATRQQSFSSLCAEYGISRKTGYRWRERYRKYGLKSLKELSRRPMSCSHKTPSKVEQLILADRRRHPIWGSKKLRDLPFTEHKVVSPPAQSRLGLKSLDRGIHEVYFAERLIGELHESAPDRLRPPASADRGQPRKKRAEAKSDEQGVTHVPG